MRKLTQWSGVALLAMAASVGQAEPFYLANGASLPGATTIGEGNSSYGINQSAFQVLRSFDVKWADTSVPVSQRFIDLSGSIGSLTSENGVGPFMFTGASLLSGDGQTTYYSLQAGPDGKPVLDFTFAHLAEGSYKLKFEGKYVPNTTPEGWSVTEWSYSAKAVASAAPEASDLVMLTMGLAGVGLMVRRRRHRQAMMPASQPA